MSALGSLLRWACIAAAGFALLGFVFFVSDEMSAGSDEQIAQLEQSGPVPANADEVQREQEAGGFREVVNDANDVLLGPFDQIVTSSDGWVTHGVPTLLAMLLYGVGGLMLVNYLLPARR